MNDIEEMLLEGRILFPVVDLTGAVCGAVGRSSKLQPRYKITANGFVGNILTDEKTLILTEMGYPGLWIRSNSKMFPTWYSRFLCDRRGQRIPKRVQSQARSKKHNNKAIKRFKTQTRSGNKTAWPLSFSEC